jgi:organic hydroperoxide reductase OsmC/OhrA
MKVKAEVQNSLGSHRVRLVTNEQEHSLDIPPRESGYGSSANGGELLFLALATCYCNDIYREAARREIAVERVEIEVEGDFGAEGEAASNVLYRAKVNARASEAEVRALMEHTDRVAEIQNTLRAATPVRLAAIEAIQASP